MKASDFSIVLGIVALTAVSLFFFLNLSSSRTPTGGRQPASVEEVAEVKVVESFAKTLENTVPVLKFSLEPGTYTSRQDLAIHCETAGCSSIIYTLDGSDPDFDKARGSRIDSDKMTMVLGPTGDGQLQIKARAKNWSGQVSEVLQGTFMMDLLPPKTTANPAGGTYSAPPRVELVCSDAGTACEAISYSLNGDTPDFAGRGIVVEGDRASFVMGAEGPGSYGVKFRAKDKSGHLEDVKSEHYEVLQPCVDSTISSTGAAPCLRSCGEGLYETSQASYDHTACVCEAGHQWNALTLRCD